MPNEKKARRRIVAVGELHVKLVDEAMPIEVGWITLDDFESLSRRVIEESERARAKSAAGDATPLNEDTTPPYNYCIKLYDAKTRALRPAVLILRETMTVMPHRVAMVEMRRASFRAILPAD